MADGGGAATTSGGAAASSTSVNAAYASSATGGVNVAYATSAHGVNPAYATPAQQASAQTSIATQAQPTAAQVVQASSQKAISAGLASGIPSNVANPVYSSNNLAGAIQYGAMQTDRNAIIAGGGGDVGSQGALLLSQGKVSAQARSVNAIAALQSGQPTTTLSVQGKEALTPLGSEILTISGFQVASQSKPQSVNMSLASGGTAYSVPAKLKASSVSPPVASPVSSAAATVTPLSAVMAASAAANVARANAQSPENRLKFLDANTIYLDTNMVTGKNTFGRAEFIRPGVGTIEEKRGLQRQLEQEQIEKTFTGIASRTNSVTGNLPVLSQITSFTFWAGQGVVETVKGVQHMGEDVIEAGKQYNVISQLGAPASGGLQGRDISKVNYGYSSQADSTFIRAETSVGVTASMLLLPPAAGALGKGAALSYGFSAASSASLGGVVQGVATAGLFAPSLVQNAEIKNAQGQVVSYDVIKGLGKTAGQFVVYEAGTRLVQGKAPVQLGIRGYEVSGAGEGIMAVTYGEGKNAVVLGSVKTNTIKIPLAWGDVNAAAPSEIQIGGAAPKFKTTTMSPKFQDVDIASENAAGVLVKVREQYEPGFGARYAAREKVAETVSNIMTPQVKETSQVLKGTPYEPYSKFIGEKSEAYGVITKGGTANKANEMIPAGKPLKDIDQVVPDTALSTARLTQPRALRYAEDVAKGLNVISEKKGLGDVFKTENAQVLAQWGGKGNFITAFDLHGTTTEAMLNPQEGNRAPFGIDMNYRAEKGGAGNIITSGSSTVDKLAGSLRIKRQLEGKPDVAEASVMLERMQARSDATRAVTLTDVLTGKAKLSELKTGKRGGVDAALTDARGTLENSMTPKEKLEYVEYKSKYEGGKIDLISERPPASPKIELSKFASGSSWVIGISTPSLSISEPSRASNSVSSSISPVSIISPSLPSLPSPSSPSNPSSPSIPSISVSVSSNSPSLPSVSSSSGSSGSSSYSSGEGTPVTIFAGLGLPGMGGGAGGGRGSRAVRAAGNLLSGIEVTKAAEKLYGRGKK